MEIKQSLYEISVKLDDIFTELEENGGELTEELAEALEIEEANYKQKAENYAGIINQYKDYIQQIKEEKKRLDARSKIFQNRVDRLSEKLLEAIIKFGPVETAKYKIGTRNSKSIELNETRINKLQKSIFNFAREIYRNGIFETGQDVDLDGMLSVINANIKAEHELISEEEFIPYTVNDLNYLKVNISSSGTITDLICNKPEMIEAVLKNEIYFDVKNETSKTDMKIALEIADDITIGSKVEKLNLSIK